MKDIIVGLVKEVIDLKTISVEITQIVRNNSNAYDNIEKVVFKILQHELKPLININNLYYINHLLKGKGVMCLVNGRNTHGLIEADVYAFGK